MSGSRPASVDAGNHRAQNPINKCICPHIMARSFHSHAYAHALQMQAAAKAGVTLDKYEIMRMEAEKARRWRAEKDDAAGGDEEKGHQPPREAGGDEGVHLGTSTDDGGGDGASNGRDVPAGDSDKPAVAPAAGKRRNDDSAVLSARERYLARKKQAT